MRSARQLTTTHLSPCSPYPHFEQAGDHLKGKETCGSEEDMDAGTKAADHYASHMGPWRFWWRQHLLKVIRLETPILAKIQNAVRTPFLDWYFAVSANIGTHTFYLVMLPVTFWYGDPVVGFDIIWVLALGVFTTGFLKDLLCLPRPMSPPLHRISMSGSAMLEYGMPSTHSSNAVSVSLVLAEFYPQNRAVHYTSMCLLVTLIAGRIYNGMHGFFDIIVGCLFGVASYELRRLIKGRFSPESFVDNALVTIAMILAISSCPDPVDDCPCFDDSVAFFGVVLGLTWALYVGPSPYAYFDAKKFGEDETARMLTFAGLRFIVGVVVIVIWRHFSKRLLLRILPPIWRVLDHFGIRNPRKRYTPASEYKKISADDVVTDRIPDSKADVKEMVSKFRHLKQKPSDFVGPQTEADLYELRAQDKITKGEAVKQEETIEEPRKHYDVEVVMRLIVYGGIPPMALSVAPIFFKLLRL